MTLTSKRAKLIGAEGLKKRWANTSQEEKSRQGKELAKKRWAKNKSKKKK